MDSGGPELSLSLKPCYVPQSISNILKDVSKIHNFSDRLLVLNEYLRKYQEELSRLKDLKNELPQCVLLLMDAIEKLEEEVMNIKIGMPAMECLSKKSIEMLRTETFEKYSKDNVFKRSSPQLLESNHGGHRQLSTILGTRRLQPWKAGIGEDAFLRASMAAKAREPGEQIQALNALSSAKWGNQRKSWRQPLHARFMAAVELLGGPEVATPKQIKELMNVEGLTIDHIKSHLQKYRIQMRKAPAASTYHPNRRA